MQTNQTPTLLPLPFAANGLRNPIPEASQITITPGAASLNDGFPPATMQPKTQGGVPPDGKDFNGILYELSQTVRWTQAGGQFAFNAAFANDPNVGGYPKYAVLVNAAGTGFWFNEADNNTSDPDATDGSARNWVPMNADWNAASGPGVILHRPDLAPVATSGSYNDLSNKPAIPAAQVNADWNAASGVAMILNKPAIQPPLGFTPVQQGGGINQGSNKIYIGWRPAGNGLGVTVDSSDQGNVVFEAELQANVEDLQNQIDAALSNAWTPSNYQPTTMNGIGYSHLWESGPTNPEGWIGTLTGRPGTSAQQRRWPDR